MGLFGKKKADEKVPATVVATVTQQPTVVDTTGVIVKPRITEKTALLSGKNVYTFEIKKGANKHEVRDAIKALYNVTPERVHIVNKEPRHSISRSRGRDMMEHGLRKAYIYLKKGDRIELV